jgi:trimeric autotransporter adhesin
LGNNLENLTLTGASVINGTGNALDNILSGNGAANVLAGGEGNDTLSDTSAKSNEVYRWGVARGNDTIADAGGADRIEVGAGATAAQVSLVRSGNNLQVRISGATDVLTVTNWYTATTNRIEEIRLAD